MKVLITVHKSVLENDVSYKGLFTEVEKNHIFDTITCISSHYKKYIFKVLQDLIRCSNSEPIITSFENNMLLSELLSNIINNCDLQTFNIGKLLNEQLFNTEDYKHVIWELERKIDSILELIKERAYVEPLVNKWLQQCERLVSFKFTGHLIEDLLSTPIRRINQYPGEIKKLIALRSNLDSFDLNISLIKINRIINHQANQVQPDHDDGYLKFNNSLEHYIESEHEFGIQNSQAAKEKSHSMEPIDTQKLNCLIKKFNTKRKNLKISLTTFHKFESNVLYFQQSQLRVAQYWKDLLLGDEFFDTIFYKYQQKLDVFTTLTENLIKQICEDIIIPLEACLEDVNQMGKFTKKFERAFKKPLNNGDIFRLGNTLLSKLPLYLIFFNDYIQIILNIYNQLIIKWLQLYIGKTKIEEYQKLIANSNFENHNDIIHYFLERKVDHI